jgi:hypothetical protein
MLSPQADALAQPTCLWHGTDLPGEPQHVDDHDGPGQQTVLEAGEFGSLEDECAVRRPGSNQ